MTYASISAQMFFAHANAYAPSCSLIAMETPPAPWTGRSVFFSWSYWCTEQTCTESLSVIML